MKRTSKITISVSEIQDERTLINHIINEIGFQNLYGISWNALRENIFYDPNMKLPEVLIITGIETLENSFPELAFELKTCFIEHESNESKFKVQFQ